MNLRRKLALGVLLAVTLVLARHGVAGAQVAEPGDDFIEPFIGIDTWLAILGLVTPFVTAVLARRTAPDWQKSVISAAVVSLVALVVEGLQDGDLTWQRWLNGSLQVLAFHLGSWLMLSDPVARVNSLIPGGLGVGLRTSTIEPVKPVPDGAGGVA